VIVQRLIDLLKSYPENSIVLVEGKDGNYCDVLSPKLYPVKIDPYHDIKKGKYCISYEEDDYTFKAIVLHRGSRF
jgi:hypothetical protein